MLNDFLNAREYENRISEKNRALQSELRYVEGLLLAETDDQIDPPTQARVNVHVAYIKAKRQDEKKWRDALYEL